MTVMSVDPDYSPEVAGLIGTSFALSISDIPWAGPLAGVNMGLVDGKLVVNPDAAQRQKTDLDLTVVGSAEKIVMIEAGANEVDAETMLSAIEMAHEEIKKMVAFIADVQAQIGKEKVPFESKELDHDIFDELFAFAPTSTNSR
jgi:polyribonucleotide nucleotidyltransferase